MFTIHAHGEEKTIILFGNRPYTYREEIGQKSFYNGHDFREAYKATRDAFPDAHTYPVRIDTGNGGCVVGWERDCAAGY